MSRRARWFAAGWLSGAGSVVAALWLWLDWMHNREPAWVRRLREVNR